MSLTLSTFFDTSQYGHSSLFDPQGLPWQPLCGLKAYLADYDYPLLNLPPTSGPLASTLILYDNELLAEEGLTIEFGDATKGKLKVFKDGALLEGASVIMGGAVLLGARISIGKGVLIEPGALIKEPTIIGDRSEIRQGAYLRGNCLIGARCVVGHVTEVKHSIFLDDAKAGHFAYLGDTILGNEVNLGAGTKMANLRFTGGDVQVKSADGPISTGLKKLGAILGDKTQTGCNSVTNPGTVLGKKSIIMPNTTAPSGLHKERSLIR
ncbi:MAG: hypothetical protein OEY01_05920 [Desulfobulbaceae bacterium]|nr:hypothetical protein [Desulfobulbaceae bacterium]HIJ78647.1 hypothetical protein [Deltaproteobacteria bacterium]